MVEPLTPAFDDARQKIEFPKYLPDVPEENRVRVPFATAMSIALQNGGKVGIMEWNHDKATMRDQLLSDGETLAALSRNGVGKIFVEVSPEHNNDIRALKEQRMSPAAFADANRIWGWGDKNYVSDSFAPMVQRTYDQGISIEPADIAEQKFQREMKSMSPDDLVNYTDVMGSKTLVRIFPDMPRAERDDLWRDLLTGATLATEENRNPSDGGAEMTETRIIQLQKIIDATFVEGAYSGRPNVRQHIADGENTPMLMLNIVQQMQWVESTIERANNDPLTADHIRREAGQSPVVVVMGAEHFLHQNGLQNNLQPMVRVALWPDRDSYENSQATETHRLLGNTTGRKAELGEMVYFMREKELYTTDTTPPEIVRQLRTIESSLQRKPEPIAAPASFSP